MNRYHYRVSPRPSRKKGLLRAALTIALIPVAVSYFWNAGKDPKVEEQESSSTKTSPATSISRPRVSVFLPLSGPFMHDGQALRDGMELAWDELRQDGFEGDLVFTDLDSDGFDVLSAAEQAVADPDNVLLMVHGPAGMLQELIPFCRQRGMALLAPANTHMNVGLAPSILTLVPSDREEAVEAGRISATLSPSQKVAVIHDTSRYGEILSEGFREGGSHSGIEVQETVLLGEVQEAEVPLTAVLGSDLVFLAGTPVWGVQIAQTLHDMNFQGKLMVPQTYDRVALDDLHERFHDRLVVLRPAVREQGSEDPSQEFTHKFVARHLREPAWLAALGYDALQWIRDDLREESLSRETFRKNLFKRFAAGKSLAGASGRVEFGPEGRVQRVLEPLFYQEGRLIPAKDSRA